MGQDTRARYRSWLLFAGLVIMSALLRATAQPQEPPAIVVEEILPDSAAARAGLHVGDRVLSYDGKPLLSPATLQAAEENTFGKQEVVLRVQRGAETPMMLIAPPGKLGIQVRPELPPAALKLYQEGSWTTAAKAAQEAGDTAAAAWLYGRVGEIHEGQQRWKEASAAHAEAWGLLNRSSDREAQSRTLFALGRCSQNLNDFTAAQQWYEQAAQSATASGNEMWLARATGNLGEVAFSRGDLTRAQDYAARALRIREKLSPDSLEVAASLNSLGAVAYRRGDFPVAQDYYIRALSIRERLSPDSLDVAVSLSNLGNLARDRGELPAALDYHTRALAIRERLAPDSQDVAASFNSLGSVLSTRDDLDGAQDYYNRALKIQERFAPISGLMGGILNSLAIVAVGRGNLVEAQDYHTRALAIRERLAPDSIEVAQSLNNLGLVAWTRGDLVAAQNYHSRALAIKERLAPNSMTVSASLNNLANVASDRGDRAAAMDYQSRALSIRERLAPNSLDVAASLNNLGNILRAEGDLVAAQDYHSRALAIRERLAPDSLNVATSLNNLGDIARSRSDPSTARDYYSRALAIKERLAPNSLNVATSLNSLGSLAWSQGDSAAALDYYGRALTIRERLAPGSLDLAVSLNNLGGVALKQSRFSDALPLLTRAVAIVESQRSQVRSTEARALLLAQYAESYTRLVRTYLALHDQPAAFAAAERARARSLLEILAEARAEIRQGIDPLLLQQERLLQEQVNAKADRQAQLLGGQHTDDQAAAARKELDAVLVQYQELQAQIRVKSPRYAALTQPLPLGLPEIQQQVLDKNTLLLEYVLHDEGSHLFAVTQASINTFELPNRTEIEEAARRLNELLMARQPVPGETMRQRQARIDKADAEYPAAAARLTDMVLGPVAGQLSDQRLLIVADGALQYVPFGALPAPTPNAAGDPRNDLTPLVVNHEIVSLPSSTLR